MIEQAHWATVDKVFRNPDDCIIVQRLDKPTCSFTPYGVNFVCSCMTLIEHKTDDGLLQTTCRSHFTTIHL